MMYEVIQPHHSNYPVPLTVAKGESVRLGHPYDGPGNWPNWVFCTTLDGLQSGWVPEQVIERQGETGVLLDDYTARELNVSAGDRVIGSRQLNGWVWCNRVGTGESGWVPEECLQPADA